MNSTSKILLGLLLLGTTFASGDDYSWDTGFAPPGGFDSRFPYMQPSPDGPLFAATSRRVSTLEGVTWQTLGEPFNGNGIVDLDINSDNNPVVGGNFGDTNVMLWDGSSWTPLGPAVSQPIEDFALDSQDRAWIGGGRIGNNLLLGTGLLEWDGSQWQARGPLFYVAEIETTIDGNVYALGKLNDNTDQFGVWNGSDWTELPGPRYAPDLIAAGSRLYALGSDYVQVFRDSVWAAIGDDTSPFNTDLDVGLEGSLYVTKSTGHVERWDGSVWVQHGSKFFGRLEVISSTIDGGLYVSGIFHGVSNRSAINTARWNTTDWYGYEEGGLGLDGQASTLFARADGSILASGDFRNAGNLRVGGVARWDGLAWHPMDYIDANQFATDSKGELYAVGVSRGAAGLFQWTGVRWQLLAETIGYGYPNGESRAITIAIDASDRIYLGGAFDEIEGVRAKRVAMWDGEVWHPLGSGVHGPPNNDRVGALTIGGDGDLYAGGRFDRVGGVEASNVARWDGDMWHPLGAGLDRNTFEPFVGSLVWSDSSLYAGGAFEFAGSVSVRNTGRWDGESWHPLDTGVNGGVSAMHSNGESIFVGGRFEWASDVLANGLARWDGLSWNPVDPALNGNVRDVTVGVDNVLYVGGLFSKAGDISSLNFASAPIPVELPDPTEPGMVVYPNPASVRVTIGVSVQETAHTRCSIFDALGRLVHVFYEGDLEAGRSYSFDVDVSRLASGSYFVHVVRSNEALTAKFAVVH